MYKVLTKVSANRLKCAIGSVISKNQLVFVEGTQILDGTLVANKVVDEARKRKNELILFKIDFEKSYDSLQWDYLGTVLTFMNFPVKWRFWILECLSSALVSILVNWCPTKEFSLKWGLR